MLNNKNLIINEKIEIPQIRLWFVWFLLFVFPSIVAIVSFNYYKDEYEYFTNTELLSRSYEKIKAYNELIIPEAYLENQIKKLKDLDTTKPTERLKKEIDKTICGESLLCMFFDEKAQNFINIKSPKANNIPLSILKTYLSNYIKYDTSSKTEDISKKFDESQYQLGTILRSVFKTASTITISKNYISKNFSVIMGGELYFIFTYFNNPNKMNYGFFAVLRGQDFSFHKMLENLHSDNPNIRLIFREIDINETQKHLEKFYSGIKKIKNEYYLIAPTNQKFARHVLHGGSEKLVPGYGRLFPFIEYRIPKEEYQEKININGKHINYLVLFIIVLSGVYFLKISLFGFKDDFSFKNKIILLILIVSLFPFTLFIIGIYNVNQFNQLISQIATQQHAETELQFYNQELKQYLTKIEYKISNYNDKITELLSDENLKQDELIEILNHIGEDIPLNSEFIILSSNAPDNLKKMFPNKIISKTYSKRISKELVNEEKDLLSQQFPKHILKILTEKNSRENAYKIEIFSNNSVESNNVNDNLANEGKLTIFDQFITPTWYTIHQIQDNKKSDNSIIGLFVCKFESKPILSYYLPDTSIFQKKYSESNDKYKIDYAFLPIERSGSSNIWEGCGIIDNDIKQLVLKNNQSGVIEYGNKTIIKKRNTLLPHLAIATISKLKNINEDYYFMRVLFWVFLYLSLVLYFSSRLLDIMFIEPVLLLSSNASAIARGSDKWNAEIDSRDEFEELNNKFRHLVTGLQERNILKSYVSEDAFTDLKESDSLKLLPGGEYIEATIVFSAIKEYDQLSSTMTPQESIKLLGKFMDLAEDITKKYDGSIDKIIGDTIMLVFRNNPDKDSHGLRAAKASLELVEKAKSVGLPNLYTGIASGQVISGRIGSYSGKLDFTVIGNPVNLAARFKAESKNGTEKTGIIISGTTIGLINGRANVKFLRRVSIKGKARKYNIYELLGIRN